MTHSAPTVRSKPAITDELRESAIDAVAGVEQVVEIIFASLDSMGGDLIDARRGSESSFDSAQMCGLQSSIFNQLDQRSSMHSAGFVIAEGILTDHPRYLEWWQRVDNTATYQPLILNLDLRSDECYDYYEMDWFDAGRTSGARFVTGPLIDLPCASVLVMTFSSPIIDGGQFLGVAGADVAVSRLEGRLIRALCAADAPCVLTNRARRVIASNSPRWRAGDKLPIHPTDEPDEWLLLSAVTHDLGWTLAIAESGQ